MALWEMEPTETAPRGAHKPILDFTYQAPPVIRQESDDLSRSLLLSGHLWQFTHCGLHLADQPAAIHLAQPHHNMT